jgi:predicted transcriptional regulator
LRRQLEEIQLTIDDEKSPFLSFIARSRMKHLDKHLEIIASRGSVDCETAGCSGHSMELSPRPQTEQLDRERSPFLSFLANSRMKFEQPITCRQKINIDMQTMSGGVSTNTSCLDNVITIKDEWSAKIFSGRKSIEVRASRPPTYDSGLYGVAVSGIPDLVVGRVKIAKGSQWEPSSKLKELRGKTAIPDYRLVEYLGRKHDGGFCWHLEQPCAFHEPITFYSDGQTTKGAPRHRDQAEAENEILAAACMQEPTEESLLGKYKDWKQRQQKNKEERENRKAVLFKERRRIARQKREERRRIAW